MVQFSWKQGYCPSPLLPRSKNCQVRPEKYGRNSHWQLPLQKCSITSKDLPFLKVHFWFQNFITFVVDCFITFVVVHTFVDDTDCAGAGDAYDVSGVHFVHYDSDDNDHGGIDNQNDGSDI